MCSEYRDDGDFKVVKCIVICTDTGMPLVNFSLDPTFHPSLLSGFVSALSMFAKEYMGRLDEISVKGLNIDMIIVQKYNLVLITVIDKGFSDEVIKRRSENLLEAFYIVYQDELKDPTNTRQFENFQEVLCSQIRSILDTTNGKKMRSDRINYPLKVEKPQSLIP